MTKSYGLQNVILGYPSCKYIFRMYYPQSNVTYIRHLVRKAFDGSRWNTNKHKFLYSRLSPGITFTYGCITSGKGFPRLLILTLITMVSGSQ